MPSAVNLQNLRRRKKRAIVITRNCSPVPHATVAASNRGRRRRRRSQALAAIAALALFLLLRHRRRLGDGLVHLDDEVTQHGVAEAERAGELVERLLVALDVQQHVVRLVDLGDRIRELAAAPVFEAMHRAAAGGDHAAVALDHGRNLLALVRMDQKHDFVMPHQVLLVVCGHPLTRLRWGKE